MTITETRDASTPDTRPAPYTSVDLHNPQIQSVHLVAGATYPVPFVAIHLTGAHVIFRSVELAREFLADLSAKIDAAPVSQVPTVNK